jgi:hypothetical protein
MSGAAPSTDALKSDARCASCGYSLAGLPAGAVCPECGVAPGEAPVRAPLAYAGTAYIELLSRWLLVAIVLALCQMPVQVLRVASAMSVSPSASQVLALVGSMGVLLLGLAWWPLSAQDPGLSGESDGVSARVLVRVSCVLAVAAGLVSVLLQVWASMLGAPFGWWHVFAREWLTIIDACALVALSASTMRYVGWLASRVPDRMLILRGKLYPWLLPMMTLTMPLCLPAPAIAIVLYAGALLRLRRHVQSIRATGCAAVLLDA